MGAFLWTGFGQLPERSAVVGEPLRLARRDAGTTFEDVTFQSGLAGFRHDTIGLDSIQDSVAPGLGLLDLDDQTRGAIFDALAEGRAEGEGVQQLADRIAIHVEAGPWNSGEYRAQLIARTETKFAQNFSTIQRALDAGVTSFIVFDGRFGLPRSTPSHIARNGSIASADEALAMAASEHPNGTLSFAPNFEE